MKLKNYAILVLLCLAFSAPLAGQSEEPIKETVSVINVEVPVRVFSDGQSVPGLSKDDFQISEDGKTQQINGFYILHKKLNASKPASGEAPQTPTAAGRYFVLIFRTYKWNEQLEKGLTYLFGNILRPQDQVLVMANNRILMIEQLGADERAQDKIRELVKTESLAAHNQMLSYVRSIEQNLNMNNFKMTIGGRADLSADYLMNFLDLYLKSWQDFKRRYLALDIDKFYYFSKHLEKIRKEKWVLNFYQLEQFPQIAFDGEIERQLRTYVGTLNDSENPTMKAQGRIIEKLLQTIDMEMKLADDFPSEEVSKLFYKVNATFHSFFMRVFNDTESYEMEFRNVATDIENSLRMITDKTGGSLLASNDLPQSLATAAEKEDDYYMLTYEPISAKKIGKIKVTVKNKKYTVLYDNNIRADYINEYLQKKEAETPSVKIKGLAFKDKKLSLSIEDFSQTKIKGETLGMLVVRIRIKNAQGQSVFDQSKNLQASKKPLSLSLAFNSLSAGKYDIIVDILDQVSSKSCTEIIQPEIH
jgi:hypothetical protein